MKLFLRIILLLPALLSQPVCKAINLWTGQMAIDWNPNVVTLKAQDFADAQVADKLVLSVEVTGKPGEWPQVALNTASWGELPAGNAPLSAGMTEVTYYLTSAMLDLMKTDGLMIRGTGYNLTAVSLEAGAGGAGYEKAVWIGEQVLPTDWSGYQALPAVCFKTASVGKSLRLKFKDLQVGATALPKKSDWTDLPDAPAKQLSGLYADYEITTDMLNELKASGCIIQGIGFTLTSVEIIGEEDLTKLQFSVPVVHNWLWTLPETPAITLNVSNPTDNEAVFRLSVRVADDKHTATTDMPFGQETLGPGSSETYQLPLTQLSTPGFYECTVFVNDDVARSFVLGLSPEEVVSPPDRQPDFDTFWKKAKDDLAATPPQYKLTKIAEKSTSQRNVYLLEMHSVSDGTGEGIARAYYAEPTAGGTYPAIIHYNGYDDGTHDPWCTGGNDNPGYCELIVSTRGQLINNRPPYENAYGDWFVYGFDQARNYYYRGAYMDAVRAIDFLCSREKVQTQNIFAEGASQGGALTLAAAALCDGRLNAIAPSIPFMGDFPDYFQVAPWPGNAAQARRQQLGMSEKEMYEMLSYFDTKNLAPMIACPVRMDFSLQDNVCPPHTNMAPYNNLASAEKSYRVNPTLGHETPGDWWTDFMAFFQEHMRQTDGISDLQLPVSTSGKTYNLQGMEVDPDTAAPGIYIKNGRKITLTRRF